MTPDQYRSLVQQLVGAAKLALHEMCTTNAPRNSFTDAVDALDEALTAAKEALEQPVQDAPHREIVEQMVAEGAESSYTVMPVGELTIGIPHSLAGFRGAFESEHKRRPTEQEIWNHAIRSWRDLNPTAASSQPERVPDESLKIAAQHKMLLIFGDGEVQVVINGQHDEHKGLRLTYVADDGIDTVDKALDAMRERISKAAANIAAHGIGGQP